MAYTTKTIHSGNQPGGVSVLNAQELAGYLDTVNSLMVVLGAIGAPAAITSAALTGTLTGTNDGALNDITFNSTWSAGQANEVNANFKEIQAMITKLIADITAVRTAVASITTAI
jgi:hypothetical protein